MKVHHYETAGGKDQIIAYLNRLSQNEQVDGYSVLKAFAEDRINDLVTQRWRGKIREVYFFNHNRFFYVIVDGNDAYILHACRKQKNKTEKTDSRIVVNRAKEIGKRLSKNFL